MFTQKRWATQLACCLIGLIVSTGLVQVQAQVKQDHRTTSTKIADLLAAMPAADSGLKNMQQTENLGTDGIAAMVKRLDVTDRAANGPLQYAIGGLSMYASGAGRQRLKNRAMQAYLKALPGLTDQQNKAFILEQLMLVGGHQAVAQIATYQASSQAGR